MQGYKRKIDTLCGGQSLLDGDGLKLPKKAATIEAITSTTEDIPSSGSLLSTQTDGFLDNQSPVSVKRPHIPIPALSPMGVTTRHELPALNAKPVYRVSERSGIVKSDSCLHFDELSCEFSTEIGEGSHGNLSSGHLTGKGGSQFVRKRFLLEEDDAGQEKKHQLRAVIKEWFFYHKLHSTAYLFLNKRDYDYVMVHIKNIDQIDEEMLASITLVSNSRNLNNQPRLVMDYLGESFERVAKEDLNFSPINYGKSELLKKSLNSVFHLLDDILDALYDMHQLGIIHGDAKPVNFVWGDALCAHPVDFGYSYFLSSRQFYNDITLPAFFTLATRDYLSRRSTVHSCRVTGLGPFVDIYALTSYLSKYQAAMDVFSMLPPSVFRNLSSFRLIELMDEQAYQAQYESRNFWVRAVFHCDTRLFKALLKFELDVIGDSLPITFPNQDTYHVMLVWLVCITLHRETQCDVRLMDKDKSLKVCLYNPNSSTKASISNGLDGVNIDNVYALSKQSPRLFDNPQSKKLFDSSIHQSISFSLT